MKLLETMEPHPMPKAYFLFLLSLSSILPLSVSAASSPNIHFWAGAGGKLGGLGACRSSFRLHQVGSTGSEAEVAEIEQSKASFIVAGHSDGSAYAARFINKLSAAARKRVKYIDFEGFAPGGGGRRSLRSPAVQGLSHVVCITATGTGRSHAPNKPYLIQSRGCREVITVDGSSQCGSNSWCLHYAPLSCAQLR